MLSPHHHRNETDFAVRDPADLIIEITLGDGRRFAQLARGHRTVTVTLECQATTVPGAGDVDTTVVHVAFWDPGPTVA